MNEFTERYENLSNSGLLKIIENSNDYQPLAVEAAIAELGNRGLSQGELDLAKHELREEQLHVENQYKKGQEQISAFKRRIDFIFDTFNPVQKGLPAPDRLIRLVTVVFSCLPIYWLITQLTFLWPMVNDGQAYWDLSMFMGYIPFLIMLAAVLLFWKRQRIGWLLFSISLSYRVVAAIYLFFIEITTDWTSGYAVLEALFPRTPPIYYLGAIIFFGGTLTAIAKKSIREIYLIDTKWMWASMGAGAFMAYILLRP